MSSRIMSSKEKQIGSAPRLERSVTSRLAAVACLLTLPLVASCSSAYEPAPDPVPSDTPVTDCGRTFVQPELHGHTAKAEVADFQAALSQHETGNRKDKWTILYPMSSTDTDGPRWSGAYGYSQHIWKNYKGYSEARLAPPAVQYQKASQDIANRLESSADGLRSVAFTWVIGPDAITLNSCQAGDRANTYADRIIGQMNQYLENPASVPRVPGVSEAVSNPGLSE